MVGTLARKELLSAGKVVTLRITGSETALIVEVDEPLSPAEEEAILVRIRRMFQLDIDIAEFMRFADRHPHLSHIREKRQGRMLRSPSLFEDVVKVICTTNTTWTQTKAMVSRIVTEFGVEGAFPTPAEIAAVPFDDFAARAKLGYRNASVHSLAGDIAEGRTDIEGWQDQALEAAQLEKNLLSLRGIGPYGAACLMLYLGKPVKVNVDSWARTMVGKELSKKVEDKEVHAFFAEYGDWCGLVYHFYPWKQETS